MSEEMKRIKHNFPLVFHYRCKKQDGTLDERGGVTVIFDPKSRTFGVARCSRKDNYNKKRGIQIAFGRAMKNSISPDVPVIKEDKMYVEVVREIAEKIKDTVSESHRPSSVRWNEL